MEKLTVGEICEVFYPIMDGVGNVVKNYTEQMLRLGHTAYAVVPGNEDAKEYDKKNNITYTIRGKYYTPIKAIRPYGLVKYPSSVRKIPFDIVHTHSPVVAANLALKLSKKHKIPSVATFHTFFRDDLKEYIPNKVIDEAIIRHFVKVYEKMDEIWVPSFWAKKKMENEYGFTKPIRVVENGCDMYVPTESQFEHYREEGYKLAGLKPGTKFFIYVGQHKDQKNLPLTLEAIKELRNRGEDCYLVTAGDGHKFNDYLKWVEGNNLSDRIRFLGRITEREKLMYLYSSAYLFLFPSAYDTSTLVMREAAAFNLPLVYLEGSCTAGGRTDGVDGFIIPQDVSAYADKLSYVLKNPAVRDEAGKGARKNLHRTWDDVGEEVNTLYHELIEKKKRGIEK